MSNYYRRNFTNRVVEMMDAGVLTTDEVASVCLRYMSERDVTNMSLSHWKKQLDEHCPDHVNDFKIK